MTAPNDTAPRVPNRAMDVDAEAVLDDPYPQGHVTDEIAAQPETLTDLLNSRDANPELACMAAFLAQYRGKTFDAYKHDLAVYVDWCTSIGITPLSATRGHLERLLTELRAMFGDDLITVPNYEQTSLDRPSRRSENRWYETDFAASMQRRRLRAAALRTRLLLTALPPMARTRRPSHDRPGVQPQPNREASRRTVLRQGRQERTERVLGLDRPQMRGGLRLVHHRQPAGPNTSLVLRTPHRADPRRSADRPPLPEPRLLQPTPSRSRDGRRQHRPQLGCISNEQSQDVLQARALHRAWRRRVCSSWNQPSRVPGMPKDQARGLRKLTIRIQNGGSVARHRAADLLGAS